MKELSVFIDESGDFGTYDYHSPWYIVNVVKIYYDTDPQCFNYYNGVFNKAQEIGEKGE